MRAQGLWGSGSVRSVTTCSILKRTSRTGYSSTLVGRDNPSSQSLSPLLSPPGTATSVRLPTPAAFTSTGSLTRSTRSPTSTRTLSRWCRPRLSESDRTVFRTPPCPGQRTTPALGAGIERPSSSSRTPRRRWRT